MDSRKIFAQKRDFYFNVGIFCVLAVITGGLCRFYRHDVPAVFPLDDAYIHLVYARNLAAGHGLSFNAGEASMGTSSPLWVALLAVAAKAGADLFGAAVLFSWCCYLTAAVLVYCVCRELLPRQSGRAYALAAALAYAASGNVTWLSQSGMETPLFHALSLLTVYVYLRRGYGPAAALAAGALLLCRVTGIFLVAPLALDAWRRQKRPPAVALISLVMLLPYYGLHYGVTGSVFPVTASGKLLTYVDGGWDPGRMLQFAAAVVTYLFLYEVGFFVLGCIAVAGTAAHIMRRLSGAPGSQGVLVLWTWLVAHVGAYVLLFRTLNQHCRYLSNIYPVLAVLGMWSLWVLLRGKRLRAAAATLLVLLCLTQQPFWRSLYAKNVRHMDRVYVACARWIVANTSDPVIAAFDIGIMKYYTGRHVLDLGGVTDQAVHPFLRNHNAGRLLREQQVGLCVYSRFPDCDVWTGIYRSAYAHDWLLQEKQLASFSVPFYSVPTMTHSFGLDVRRIGPWVAREGEAAKRLFYVADEGAGGKSPVGIVSGLQLLRLSLSRRRIEIVKNMVQSADLLYLWRAAAPVAATPVVRTRFVHVATGAVIMDKAHIPTHNVISPMLWPPGQVVRERHTVWIPHNAPTGTYEIRVSAGSQADLLRDAEDVTAAYGAGAVPAQRAVRGEVRAGNFMLQQSVVQLLY